MWIGGASLNAGGLTRDLQPCCPWWDSAAGSRPIMEEIRSRKNFTFKKSPIATALPKPSHYNAKGVVEKPDFVMVRPKGAADEIKMTVRAHPIGKGQWIA